MWYASFWRFCADYLNSRFDAGWCLSPEQSISLHAGDWTVPKQLLVRTPKGGNKPTALLHNTSVFDIRAELPLPGDIERKQGLQVMKLPAALIACAPGEYAARPATTRTALAMAPNASEVLRGLLAGGHSKVAGRLAGAFRNIGRVKIADDIVASMRAAGYVIQESDPFEDAPAITFGSRETSPYVNRMRMMWAAMRGPVLENFPSPPRLPGNKRNYLDDIDGLYINDAYNSLSIEGYRVSARLIDRVRLGIWDPDNDDSDRENRHCRKVSTAPKIDPQVRGTRNVSVSAC